MSRIGVLLAVAALCTTVFVCARQIVVADEKDGRVVSDKDEIDPTAWGSDHVGKSIPQYVTGDECLFCHRKIGPTWPENRHQMTVRPATDDDKAFDGLRQHVDDESIYKQIRFVMGHSRVTRFAKRSDKYGKLDLLSAKIHHRVANDADTTDPGKLSANDDVHWDDQTFADRCAGCHTTAVDTETRAFSAISLDCFVCHGNVDLAHTTDPKFVLLSRASQEARVVASICGQCHLRGGKSKSTGLPYPNTFVAGDNLFRDFEIDLSMTTIKSLAPNERHIFENVRDVVVLNRSTITCVSCHSVHEQSTEKHQQLNNSTACATCHIVNSDNTQLRESFLQSRGTAGHSAVCDY